jgi:predicted negative regulator of RcsB-dependent stress response
VDLLSEDEQWDALKARMKVYGPAILAGLALGGALWYGWGWYQRYQEGKLQDASTRYEAVIAAYERNDVAAGNAQVEELRREHPESIYGTAAQLAQAKMLVMRGELDAAAAALGRVADNAEPELGLVARLRLARIQVEQAKYDEALKTLEGETGAYAGPFAHVRGDALLRKGDTAGALREYRLAREELAKVADTGAAAEITALLDLKINDLQDGGTP